MDSFVQVTDKNKHIKCLIVTLFALSFDVFLMPYFSLKLRLLSQSLYRTLLFTLFNPPHDAHLPRYFRHLGNRENRGIRDALVSRYPSFGRTNPSEEATIRDTVRDAR